MTTASTKLMSEPSAAPFARALVPGNLAAAGVLLAAFALLFHNWFVVQHGHSWGNDDWSHAYFIPLVSVYLLWHVRKDLARAAVGTFWPGLVPMVTGIACYVYFIVGIPNHFGQGLAMLLTLAGLVLLMLGPSVLQVSFAAIAYLGFAITLPEKIMIYVTWPLQQIAAEGAYITLNIIGIRTDIAGNVITVYDKAMNGHPLNVAEQCSGMRMVIAFIALGVAVALVGTRAWWKRVVLVGMAVPVAVLLNVLRVVVLGAMSLANANWATGQAHMFLGTLLLVPGFVLYMLVLWSLNKAVPEGEEDVAPATSIAPRGAAA